MLSISERVTWKNVYVCDRAVFNFPAIKKFILQPAIVIFISAQNSTNREISLNNAAQMQAEKIQKHEIQR